MYEQIHAAARQRGAQGAGSCTHDESVTSRTLERQLDIVKRVTILSGRPAADRRFPPNPRAAQPNKIK